MNFGGALLVSSSKEIVVKDACILFDLIDLKLLSPFFQLDLVVLTTPQVMAEITDPAQMEVITAYIQNGKLILDGWGQLEVIDALLEENKGLSFADSSVLELALRKSAVLLSSDGSLRKISIKRNLTVRGVLWIVEELCEKGIITRSDGLERLVLYPQINPRAPRNEIDKLISKLSSSQ